MILSNVWLVLLAMAPMPGASASGTGGVMENVAIADSAVPAGMSVCLATPNPSEYYAIDMVPTRQVVGTGLARGVTDVTFDTSPFGVDVAPDGSYRTTLHVRVDGLPARSSGRFVAWATTPSLDQAVRVGTLDDEGYTKGIVEWNKFLLLVTLEPDEEAGSGAEAGWSGPIVMRGMSRSGRMHTMAGHGPFEQQECRTFGY